MSLAQKKLWERQLKVAGDEYARTDDWAQYVAEVTYTAASISAAALADTDPQLKHLGKVVAAARHLIKGAAKTAASSMECPEEGGFDHSSYLSHFWENTTDQARRDLDSIKNLLSHL